VSVKLRENIAKVSRQSSVVVIRTLARCHIIGNPRPGECCIRCMQPHLSQY
ncbi:hypothetical protein NEUTE2DRAFT_34461, partial [Neurospora tetrasperma FGSC 2509]